MKQKLPSSIRAGRVSYRRAVLTLAILLMGLPLLAQTITGTVVSSEAGQALPGVSILVKGTTSGTTTRTDGTYTLNVPNPSSVLIYSFIGFEAQEVSVGSKTNINVTLAVSTQALNEVVVTALGISKQQRNLGYVTQKIDNSALSQARETNLVSQLAGKIAGVTVVNSPSGIGGSSRITIRGEKSLNINANQPLFVIDGLPINNNFVGSSGRNNQDADFGNGAGFINPDDVETMTVLKGASATALYGSRAANGVVVITTKTGKGTKGIGVSVNSNVTFESVLRLPDYQNVYGQGLNGQFTFKDGSGGGLRDGVDESWGPKMDGRLIVQHDSPTDKGYRAGDTKVPGGPGVATPTPFISHPNSVRDFFETGRIENPIRRRRLGDPVHRRGSHIHQQIDVKDIVARSRRDIHRIAGVDRSSVGKDRLREVSGSDDGQGVETFPSVVEVRRAVALGFLQDYTVVAGSGVDRVIA